MDEWWLRVWERGITHMVFYVRSWQWSCWCRLLLITADCWWLLLVAGWLLVAAEILLVAAGYWMIAADCRSATCRRKGLWIFSKRRWRSLAKTSFKIVLEYFEFRRGDEEIWQRTSFKIVLEYFEEAMRKFCKDKFWNCLRIFRRGDEEIWERQVLKLS